MTHDAWDAGGCNGCDYLGFYYKPSAEGKLKLCSCVEKLCKCGGVKPYQYFDEDMRPKWCVCGHYRMEMARRERLIENSGVPTKFRWKFFEDFKDIGSKGKTLQEAQKLRGYISTAIDLEGKEGPKKGFFFWGTVGNGKTLLGCIALNELILRSGKPGKFVDLSFSYFQKLRSSYSEESGFYGQTFQIIEELGSIPFLVIDDFGVQRNTPWELEMLYNLIDARYKEEKFSIITTNEDINEIKQLFEGRIYSRLLEMCHIVHVTLPDYRLNFEKLF